MVISRVRPLADSNVLFSGLYGSGAPAIILNHHSEGRLTIVVSRLVLAETANVKRRKRPGLLPVLKTFFGRRRRIWLTTRPPTKFEPWQGASI